MKDELASLIERIANRDRRAFEELYRLTSRKMFAVAMRIVREPGVAQDVIQDSYIRLWRYAHTFNAKLSAPETWLHQVVRNRALDLISQQGYAQNCISIDQFADNDDGEPNALLEAHSTHADEGDSGQVMRDCVQKLEGKYRQVLTLAYNHGMSHAEIADHLDVPLGTVKTWARRGLIELKAVYDEYQSELTAMSLAAVNKHRQDAEQPGFMA
ncbi:sigma-70 family RNA polymerase sigma factor [Limnobacter humi]|uniref:Sigma-70 family RNA polymerase sigma factor n=1 Tax=Limnobacter humi TaxID=1778671 RepID=A0ABT1WIE1_9BURK|nr:sigma-70 family RNA polymerase sigma factor [Limnobacter humi]MCQ8897275.1 sigma-70 family RNA polymerase sigma factor [Limnobacter humi]